MPRWLRIVRGMIGTGLTFAAGVGVVASVVAGIAWLLPGVDVGREILIPVVGAAVWSFPIGVVFSGFLALTARGRSIAELSIARFAALGVVGGLLLYGVLAANAWSAWTLDAAVVNAVLFVLLGGGSATATLLLARKAAALESRDDALELTAGSDAETSALSS